MRGEIAILKLLKVELQNDVAEKNRLLFNAFVLARRELFEKAPPYDFEALAIITDAYYKYLDVLDVMGKHELYTG